MSIISGTNSTDNPRSERSASKSEPPPLPYLADSPALAEYLAAQMPEVHSAATAENRRHRRIDRPAMRAARRIRRPADVGNWQAEYLATLTPDARQRCEQAARTSAITAPYSRNVLIRLVAAVARGFGTAAALDASPLHARAADAAARIASRADLRRWAADHLPTLPEPAATRVRAAIENITRSVSGRAMRQTARNLGREFVRAIQAAHTATRARAMAEAVGQNPQMLAVSEAISPALYCAVRSLTAYNRPCSRIWRVAALLVAAPLMAIETDRDGHLPPHLPDVEAILELTRPDVETNRSWQNYLLARYRDTLPQWEHVRDGDEQPDLVERVIAHAQQLPFLSDINDSFGNWTVLALAGDWTVLALATAANTLGASLATLRRACSQVFEGDLHGTEDTDRWCPGEDRCRLELEAFFDAAAAQQRENSERKKQLRQRIAAATADRAATDDASEAARESETALRERLHHLLLVRPGLVRPGSDAWQVDLAACFYAAVVALRAVVDGENMIERVSEQLLYRADEAEMARRGRLAFSRARCAAEIAVAEVRAARARAARRCPCPGPAIHLRHRETRAAVVMRRGCERWNCPACGQYLRTRDLETMALHLRQAEERGLKLYTALIYPDDWQTTYYRLRRRGAAGFLAYHDTDADGQPCLIVVASAPADAAFGMGMGETATNAIGSMRAAFAAWQGDGSPIAHHSDSWPVSRLEKSGEYERVGLADTRSATPDGLAEIAAAVGSAARIEGGEGGDRIVFWGKIALPDGASVDDREYLDFLIAIGEVIPRSIWDAFHRKRPAPDTPVWEDLVDTAVSGADDLGDLGEPAPAPDPRYEAGGILSPEVVFGVQWS